MSLGALSMTDLPETEGAMRAWLRSRTRTAAKVAERVYFAAPESDEPILPCLIFYRVGGLPDAMGQDYPDFIIEAWGATKHEASTTARDVCADIMDSQHMPPVIVNGVKVMQGDVNLGPLPTSGTGKAKRYRIDASMHMRVA